MSILENYVAQHTLFEKNTPVEQYDAIIKQLVVDGWVPVTPERQPYMIDLLPQMMPELEKQGFVRVETTVFEIGEQSYTVCTRRFNTDVKASDLPEDLLITNAHLMPALVDFLHDVRSTHVRSVLVTRSAFFGYLPPNVMISVRSANTGKRKHENSTPA